MLLIFIPLVAMFQYSKKSKTNEFIINREMLNTSEFLKYYREAIIDDASYSKNILEYIRSIDSPFLHMFSQRTNRQSQIINYIFTVMCKSLIILTNERHEFLLSIIINTRSEVQHIGQISPFAYMVIHHINRIYEYCKNEKNISLQYSRNKTSKSIFEGILSLNGIRPKEYISDMALKLNDTNRLGNTGYLVYEHILNVEIMQLYYEYTIIKEDCEKYGLYDFEDNLDRLLSYIKSIQDDQKEAQIVIQGRDIYKTQIIKGINDIEGKSQCELPFKDFQMIQRIHSKSKDYILSTDGLLKYTQRNVMIHKLTMEVYLALLLFFNTRYDIKIMINIRRANGSYNNSGTIIYEETCNSGENLDYYIILDSKMICRNKLNTNYNSELCEFKPGYDKYGQYMPEVAQESIPQKSTLRYIEGWGDYVLESFIPFSIAVVVNLSYFISNSITKIATFFGN